MFGFVKKVSKNFWFTPLKVSETAESDKNVNNCEKIHGKIGCFDRWKKVKIEISKFKREIEKKKNFEQEMKETAKFAFGIAAVKSILPRVLKMLRNPLTIPKTFVKKFDYGVFMFFISMNGIFKV